MICTSWKSDIKPEAGGGTYASLKYYANRQHETSFYGVGAADRMLAIALDGEKAALYNVTGEREQAVFADPEPCRDALLVKEGWSSWCTNYGTDRSYEYYYFVDNRPVTGRYRIDKKTYHFEPDGFMYRGWLAESGEQYYVNNAGEMATEVQEVDGETYLFTLTGELMGRWNPAVSSAPSRMEKRPFQPSAVSRAASREELSIRL